MRAVILAAGLGSRLGRHAKGRPKALQPVGGATLIEHQLAALSAEGVGPVAVVVGHGGDQIRKVLGESVEYVVNPRPDETNSLYSLWLAREWLDGDVLILNSDLLFHPDVLKRLLKQPGCALAFDSVSHGGAEETKIGLVGSRVTDLGKDLPATGSRGENLGMIKLDAEGTRVLLARAEAIIEAGGENTWVTEAVRSILSEVHMTGVNVAGLPWVEIDFPYDLDTARRKVWPEIERSLHPYKVGLRRVRFPLLAAGVAGLIVAVWGGSAQVGPASIDWESIHPLNDGIPVKLHRQNRGTQRWWLVERSQGLDIPVQGGLPVRVEARPVLDGGMTEAAYVLELEFDGAFFHYEANRGEVDDAVTLDGMTIGARDRDQYEVPTGARMLRVNFLTGVPKSLLLRIRQPA
ncbi:MAG: NTP transferase domain-containing protein [Gemmatimonadota bacterium]